MNILQVNDIHTFYGSSHILFDISLIVEEQETVCLLGRNGAGKTTTLKSIIGLLCPRSGKIIYKGKEIQGKPAFKIARTGISYVPDTKEIFPDLTVRENLEVSLKGHPQEGVYWTVFKVYEIFPVLKAKDKTEGARLSGGEQQMLAIGRALMNHPDLLLLDEPSEGLSPLVRRELAEQIRGLSSKGMTIMLAEQNSEFAMSVSQRAYIIEKGRIFYEGTIDQLKENYEIRRRYLAV